MTCKIQWTELREDEFYLICISATVPQGCHSVIPSTREQNFMRNLPKHNCVIWEDSHFCGNEGILLAFVVLKRISNYLNILTIYKSAIFIFENNSTFNFQNHEKTIRIFFLHFFIRFSFRTDSGKHRNRKPESE